MGRGLRAGVALASQRARAGKRSSGRCTTPTGSPQPHRYTDWVPTETVCGNKLLWGPLSTRQGGAIQSARHARALRHGALPRGPDHLGAEYCPPWPRSVGPTVPGATFPPHSGLSAQATRCLSATHHGANRMRACVLATSFDTSSCFRLPPHPPAPQACCCPTARGRSSGRLSTTRCRSCPCWGTGWRCGT